MPVISKWVAELSFVPGVITRPDVLCVFSDVVVSVAFGPASVTVIAALAVGPLNPLTSAVVDSWTVKPPATSDPAFGVNFSPAPPWPK